MRSERGQTAAEFVGALLVVSVIVAAIASSGLGGAFRGATGGEVCKFADSTGEAACGGSRAQPDHRRPATHLVARAASIPCDGLTPRQCSALRALMARAQAEHEQQVEAYIRYAADFALWVQAAEGIADVKDVIARPGIFKAVNALIGKQVNREGARLLTSVKNESLFNLVKTNYRWNARIGKGSTADALRDEVARGVKYGTPKSHYIKAQESINRLNKILTRESLSRRERQIATNIRGELWSALPANLRPPLQ